MCLLARTIEFDTTPCSGQKREIKRASATAKRFQQEKSEKACANKMCLHVLCTTDFPFDRFSACATLVNNICQFVFKLRSAVQN